MPNIFDMTFSDPNNNEDYNSSTSLKEDKYTLRPRSVRRVTEHFSKASDENQCKPEKSQKPKQKAPPLSKYRRKTANARERNRMREINQAFETLRRVIPHVALSHGQGSNEKLTKITTLRLAMKYINSLSSILEGTMDTSHDFFSDCSDLDSLLLESDGESLPLSDQSSFLNDFPEPSLSPVDFSDPSLPSLLCTDLNDPCLGPTDFSEYLLT